jgi:hypothetical protein
MKPVSFYEIQDRKGEVQTGTASASEAVEWFRRGLDNTIFVSVWDESDSEEPRLITDKINVTALVLATITSEREKAR